MVYYVCARSPGLPRLAVKDAAGATYDYDGHDNVFNPMFPKYVEAAVSKYGFVPIDPPIQVDDTQIAQLARNLAKR